ncbi:MAG: molybdate ABC transporter substrate-binding protein [Bacillota bacterium]|nr:molybdate ABC transporter substrate-binding protein [Bacillota bacterium]
MKNLKKFMSLILTLVIIAISVACGNSSQQTNNSTAQVKDEKAITLTISAAASLKDAMNDIKKLYVKDHPKANITYNFGASGTLQQQIEQGAPTDIFMSAATKQMDELKSKNLLVNDTITNLLSNKLVLVTPKNSTDVKDFTDLASDKVKKVALGEPKAVPAGQYAQDALTSLKILDKVQPKVVQAKDVKEVLTWVETGNVDAGVVYETDAKVSDKVKIAATAPESSHKPIVYPAAVIKNSKSLDDAKAFLKFLSSDEAKAIFKKYGFGVK